MYTIIEKDNGQYESVVITPEGILTELHNKKVEAILWTISTAHIHNKILIFRDNIKFIRESNNTLNHKGKYDVVASIH